MNRRFKYVKIFIAIGIVITLILYFLVYKGIPREQPSSPSIEEQLELENYENKCKFVKLLRESGGNPINQNFRIKSFECSESNLSISEGEEIEVEIYTKDFEQGKQEFKTWLNKNNLQESEILRITYEHKPK